VLTLAWCQPQGVWLVHALLYGWCGHNPCMHAYGSLPATCRVQPPQWAGRAPTTTSCTAVHVACTSAPMTDARWWVCCRHALSAAVTSTGGRMLCCLLARGLSGRYVPKALLCLKFSLLNALESLACIPLLRIFAHRHPFSQ
jgi:hypothetical protein